MLEYDDWITIEETYRQCYNLLRNFHGEVEQRACAGLVIDLIALKMQFGMGGEDEVYER